MLEAYAKAITDEYNVWHKQYQDAEGNGNTLNMSIAAFFCNAISNAVIGSSHPEVKEYFQKHAKV